MRKSDASTYTGCVIELCRSRRSAILMVVAITISLFGSLSTARAQSSTKLRNAELSIADLSQEQELQLSVSALAQQLLYGPVHGDFLPVEPAEAEVKSLKGTGVRTASAGQPWAGQFFRGMSWGAASIIDTIARVPVRHFFAATSEPVEKEPWYGFADTIIFVYSDHAWRAAHPSRTTSPTAYLIEESRKKLAASRSAADAGMSVSLAGAFDAFIADSMLLGKKVTSTVPILNAQTSRSEFDADLFAVPFGVCANLIRYGDIDHHDYICVSDISACRLVAADETEPWISFRGDHGSGLGQFNYPMGMAINDHSIEIADANNNRIVYATLTRDGTSTTGISWDGAYTFGFNHPTDVDFRYGVDGEMCSFSVIADYGNDRVVHRAALTDISPNCDNFYVMDIEQTGLGSFSRPISVCYERDFLDHRQKSDFYVADQGNERLVKVYWPPYPKPETWNFWAYDMPGTKIVSVDVDNFGQVYALDARAGRLYKMSSLGVPIAVFEFSTGLGNIIYPYSFCIAHGRRWTTAEGYSQLVLGDMFLTESYTGETGVHRYTLGVDLLYPQATYVAPTPQQSQDRITAQFYLTDVADVTVTITRDSVLQYQNGPTIRASGQQPPIVWELPLSAEDGDYVVSVDAASVYSGSNTSSWEHHLTVERGDINHLPVIVSNPDFLYPCECMEPGNDYWITIDAHDPDSDPLTYHWDCDEYSQFENGLDTISTPVPRVLYSAKAKKSTDKGPAIPPSCTIQALVRDDRGGSTESQVTYFDQCQYPATDECCVCEHQCDYDLDGFITALDMGYMIDVLFAGLPDPQDPKCPTTYSDFDYDGFPTTLDLGGLMDHLFYGGTAPCDPCLGIPAETCSQ